MTDRRLLLRYSPLFAILAALAVFVVLVPSSAPETRASGVEELFGAAPSANDATGGAEGDAFVDSGTVTSLATGAGSAGGSVPNSPRGSTGSTGSAGAEAAVGTEAGGAALDCARNEVIKNDISCRPPTFAGDNGGATAFGVTATEVNVVLYLQFANQQVQAILTAAGVASDAQKEAAARSIHKWFNDNFELYGRKVNLIVQKGTGTDASSYQADAVKSADEHKAFAVIAPGAGLPYFQELHRRNIPVFATFVQGPAKYYEDLAPHAFSVLPDRDYVVETLAEYMCKRLVGRNAVHADDAALQAQERKIGVIWQSITEDDGPVFEAALERQCGVKVTKSVSYPSEVENAVSIATNTVAQMKAAGVTTVTCLCDAIAPLFFTQQATNQRWFPEWIHNGYNATDSAVAGRAYDPVQWDHSFGPSSLGYPLPSAIAPGTAACRAGGTSDDESCKKGAGFSYTATLIIFDALEATGPQLDDRRLAQTIFNTPPRTGLNCGFKRCSFGRNGPSPFTYTDDFTEIWWSSTRAGPDGKPGAVFYVGGKDTRYQLGQWPTSDPVVFVDDGSEQPPRDPDA